MTNFDLSTYIRWLKPGANRSPQFQEQKLSFESQPMINLSNHIIPKDQTTNLSICNSNPFKVEAFNSTPKTQPILQTRTPVNLNCTESSSSSPTALSLLLRSSVFKELVEKNLNATGKESTGEHDTKNLPQLIGSNDEVGKMLFNEIGVNPAQYTCPSSKMYRLA